MPKKTGAIDPMRGVRVGKKCSAQLARLAPTPAEAEELLAVGPYLVLTDEYAPVEQLLAAVVRNELPKGVAPPTPAPESWGYSHHGGETVGHAHDNGRSR